MLVKWQKRREAPGSNSSHYFQESPFLIQDVIFYHCGEQHRSQDINHCTAGDHFLIHVVYHGKGYLKLSGESEEVIPVKAGDVFLITPDCHASYHGDVCDPWSYGWIGIQGKAVEGVLALAGFDHIHSVLNFDDSIIQSLRETLRKLIGHHQEGKANPMEQLSLTCHFLGQLLEGEQGLPLADKPASRSQYYLEAAQQYIHDHYGRKFSLEELAGSVGVSRKHLSTLFKEKYGQTLKSYLTTYRVRRACELLRQQPPKPIETVALDVGYDDIQGFSKIFSKYMFVSPSQYREKTRTVEYVCSGLLR
ncbi:MAG: helix-turn-helix domain-containing protein [Endozoicomonas sp.]